MRRWRKVFAYLVYTCQKAWTIVEQKTAAQWSMCHFGWSALYHAGCELLNSTRGVFEQAWTMLICLFFNILDFTLYSCIKWWSGLSVHLLAQLSILPVGKQNWSIDKHPSFTFGRGLSGSRTRWRSPGTSDWIQIVSPVFKFAKKRVLRETWLRNLLVFENSDDFTERMV